MSVDGVIKADNFWRSDRSGETYWLNNGCLDHHFPDKPKRTGWKHGFLRFGSQLLHNFAPRVKLHQLNLIEFSTTVSCLEGDSIFDNIVASRHTKR